MYSSSRRKLLKGVSIGIGLVAIPSAFANDIEVGEGYVDMPLAARTVGNLILKTGGPINFTSLTREGLIACEFSSIGFQSSINPGLDQNADVRVSFAYRAELAFANHNPGIDYAFVNGDRILMRGALYTQKRVGVNNWPDHGCHTRYEVSPPALLVQRAIFLQAETFRFIVNADRLSPC